MRALSILALGPRGIALAACLALIVAACGPEACMTPDPILQPVEAGHDAACHFATEEVP